jgi:hypothetical protein
MQEANRTEDHCMLTAYVLRHFIRTPTPVVLCVGLLTEYKLCYEENSGKNIIVYVLGHPASAHLEYV